MDRPVANGAPQRNIALHPKLIVMQVRFDLPAQPCTYTAWIG